MASRITSIRPRVSTDGGRVTIEGGRFPVEDSVRVSVGGVDAPILFASPTAVGFATPPVAEGGRVSVRLDAAPGETAFLHLGELIATGLHQVDSPAIAADGTVYLTYSGSRGQQAPVSIYRVLRSGPREIFATGLTNPTSMAIDPEGRLCVSSRFDGTVTRYAPDGQGETVASDLGIACGICFAADGTMFVGDRAGTILRVAPDGDTAALALLPQSVAAFHLALGPDNAIYVTAPTLSTADAVYRVGMDGDVEVVTREFGRPQGLAFDPSGRLHVVEALAGASGIYRIGPDGRPELVVSGVGLIGISFHTSGSAVAVSGESAWWLPAEAFQ